MNERNRKLRLNIISSFIFYIVYALTGFIHPKLLLNAFGSEIYGLVASITRFLSFNVLAEGGVTAVVAANLYKPLIDKDEDKINEIVNAANAFFSKIGYLTLIYSLILGSIYPLFVDGYGIEITLPLTIIIAFPYAVSYFVCSSLITLVSADEKSYIVNFEMSLSVVVNVIFVYIITRYTYNVLYIKIASLIAYFVQPIIYLIYCRRNYKYLKRSHINKRIDELLPQRKDGFAHNLAAYIHDNADYYVLTLFSSLINVAIYAVYELVIISLRNAIKSIATSLAPSFGKIFASNNKEESRLFFDEYELIINFLIAIIFSCTSLLIVPFVSIYTSNIGDANYVIPIFGLLFTAAGITDCLREPFIEATYASGRFKDTKIIAYIETLINVVFSIALVKRFGLSGVLIATVMAMMFRFIAENIFVSKNIINRKISISIKKFVLCICPIVLNYFICIRLFNYELSNYIGWIIVAIKTGVVCLIVCIVAYFIFDNKILKLTLQRLITRREK